MNPADLTPPPGFWLELATEFSRQLSLPLEVSASGFAESRALSDGRLGLARGALVGASPGLVLYQRQVWMRFFETLQQLFPRLSAGLGYFEFNKHAHRFLLAMPSRHVDLGRLGSGFGEFLRGQAQLSAPLLECLLFDEAEERARRAPFVAPWQPALEDLTGLSHDESRLRYAPSFALVVAHFRVQGGGDAGPARFVPLDHPEHFVCLRERRKVVVRRIAAPLARFLALCRERPFPQALEELAKLAPSGDPQGLDPQMPGPQKPGLQELAVFVQRSVQEAVQAGYWVGLADPGASR